MIKRLTWFISGVVAGIGSFIFAGRRVKKTVSGFTPVKMAGRTVEATKSRVQHFAEAFREGRDTMRQRESELRARRDGRVQSLDRDTSLDPIRPGDEIRVAGQRVDPDQVIVLRQVDEPQTSNARRHRIRRTR